MLKGQKLQETFLNALCQAQVPVSMFLVNGIKLEGQVVSFDQYAVLLKSHVTQMIYKHAISTVVPLRNFQLPLELELEHAPKTQPGREKA